MGLTAECDVLCEEQVYRCKAYLDERELILRGEFRLTVPFAEIGSFESDDERLVLHHSGQSVTLVLGKDARTWAAKIAHPVSLIDKLGVKEGQVVSVLGAGCTHQPGMSGGSRKGRPACLVQPVWPGIGGLLYHRMPG